MAELEFLDPRDELILLPRHLLQEILDAEHAHHLRRGIRRIDQDNTHTRQARPRRPIMEGREEGSLVEFR